LKILNARQIFIYLSISSDFSLKIFDERRVIIRLGHVRRYSVNVSEKTATHITAECADVYESLIVPAEVHMMCSEKSAEQPEKISPELAFHAFVSPIVQSIFFHFFHVIFWINRSQSTHFDSYIDDRVNITCPGRRFYGIAREGLRVLSCRYLHIFTGKIIVTRNNSLLFSMSDTLVGDVSWYDVVPLHCWFLVQRFASPGITVWLRDVTSRNICIPNKEIW